MFRYIDKFLEKQLTNVTLLMKKVANPRNPFIINPARIHLISEIPEPAEYLPKDLTRCAAVNENIAWGIQVKCGRYNGKHSNQPQK